MCFLFSELQCHCHFGRCLLLKQNHTKVEEKSISSLWPGLLLPSEPFLWHSQHLILALAAARLVQEISNCHMNFSCISRFRGWFHLVINQTPSMNQLLNHQSHSWPKLWSVACAPFTWPILDARHFTPIHLVDPINYGWNPQWSQCSLQSGAPWI